MGVFLSYCSGGGGVAVGSLGHCRRGGPIRHRRHHHRNSRCSVVWRGVL